MFRGPLTLTVACDGLSLLMVESAAAAFATGWRCGRITCPKVHGVLEALDTEQAGENQHLECVFCAVKSLHLPMLCRWGLSCVAYRRRRSTAITFGALASFAFQWRNACQFRRLQISLLPRKPLIAASGTMMVSMARRLGVVAMRMMMREMMSVMMMNVLMVWPSFLCHTIVQCEEKYTKDSRHA